MATTARSDTTFSAAARSASPGPAQPDTRLMLLADLDGTVRQLSPGVAQLLGRDPAEIVGAQLYGALPSGEASEVPFLVRGLLAAGLDQVESVAQIVDANGRPRRMALRFVLVRDGEGAPMHLHVEMLPRASDRPSVIDTRRGPTSAQPTRRDPDSPVRQPGRDWLVQLLEVTGDMVLLFEPGHQLREVNTAGRERLGLDDTDPATVTVVDLYTPESMARYMGEVIPALREGGSWKGELAMRKWDSLEVLRVEQTILGGPPKADDVAWVAVLGQELTDHDLLAAELAHRAMHDALTGLPNRSLLLNRLERATLRAAEDGRSVALAFFDLDRFKAVNDNMGHNAGDQLLKQVGQRISELIRPSDTVARLAGDEFVVVCEGIEDERHAVEVITRITDAINQHPFPVAAANLAVTASCGIALSWPPVHPEALLRDADAAMYRAKRGGGARIEIFDDEMRSRTADRTQLTERLERALDAGEITTHFQPTVDLATGAVHSVEALARWNHPGRGLIPPTEFIGLAEDTGLGLQLGLTVMEQACSEAAGWSRLVASPPAVHVNLSPRQLSQPNLAVMVAGLLETVGLAPSRLVLEITENVLVVDADATRTRLEELSALGVRIGIDDFGTGYSSLAHLRRLPLDILKIDRSFVEELGQEGGDHAVVAAIVSLGQKLGLASIAEGVERPEQAQILRELGCDSAQGFLYSRPVPAKQLHELLTERPAGG